MSRVRPAFSRIPGLLDKKVTQLHCQVNHLILDIRRLDLTHLKPLFSFLNLSRSRPSDPASSSVTTLQRLRLTSLGQVA